MILESNTVGEATDTMNMSKTQFRDKLKMTRKVLDGDILQKAYELYLKGVATTPAEAYYMAKDHMQNMAFEGHQKD